MGRQRRKNGATRSIKYAGQAMTIVGRKCEAERSRCSRFQVPFEGFIGRHKVGKRIVPSEGYLARALGISLMCWSLAERAGFE